MKTLLFFSKENTIWKAKSCSNFNNFVETTDVITSDISFGGVSIHTEYNIITVENVQLTKNNYKKIIF